MVSSSDTDDTFNILLVEDNPGDVRLMKEALSMSAMEHRLHVVTDGEQAVRFLQRHPPFESAVRPDLIFLDLNLPKKDGREVLADVKTDRELRRIPVIVLTTSEAERDVQNAYNLYANCYVRKPADLDEYMYVVRACEVFWSKVVVLPK
jgi:CheY-like chemotaxis protein